MRRIILIWLVMCVCLSVRAQYTSYNSFIRKALISYQRNSKGFYERKAEEMLDVVTVWKVIMPMTRKHRIFMS